MYDEKNVFAKIIKGEISSNKIYEDDSIFAFYDIRPKAKIHALVIPKSQTVDFSDFVKSEDTKVANFFKKVNFIGREVLKLESFRLIMNNGKNAGQEVFHFHVHILSNE